MGVLDRLVTEESPRHPKVLLWGRAGLGKTVTALWIARRFGLRILGIDADGGLGIYRSSKEPDGSKTWPAMDTLEGSDPIAVTQGIEELLADPRKWGLFLIDPVSMLLKSAEAKTDETARRKKNAKRGGTIEDYETAMDMSSRQNINRVMFLLTRDLWRLRMPVIVTAREKESWKTVGGKTEHVGTVPLGTDGFDHEFDIVVRLVRLSDAGTTLCYVTKDRLRRLPSLVECPPGNPFVLAEVLADTYRDLWVLDTSANPRCSDEQEQRIHELQIALGVTGKQMATFLSKEHGVTEIADLRPEQAASTISRMEARLAAVVATNIATNQPNPTQPTNQPTPTNA